MMFTITCIEGTQLSYIIDIIVIYFFLLNICLVHVKGESLNRHSLLLNPIHLVVNKICLKQNKTKQVREIQCTPVMVR
jgi:hypothetical protein